MHTENASTFQTVEHSGGHLILQNVQRSVLRLSFPKAFMMLWVRVIVADLMICNTTRAMTMDLPYLP